MVKRWGNEKTTVHQTFERLSLGFIIQILTLFIPSRVWSILYRRRTPSGDVGRVLGAMTPTSCTTVSPWGRSTHNAATGSTSFACPDLHDGATSTTGPTTAPVSSERCIVSARWWRVPIMCLKEWNILANSMIRSVAKGESFDCNLLSNSFRKLPVMLAKIYQVHSCCWAFLSTARPHIHSGQAFEVQTKTG